MYSFPQTAIKVKRLNTVSVRQTSPGIGACSDFTFILEGA